MSIYDYKNKGVNSRIIKMKINIFTLYTLKIKFYKHLYYTRKQRINRLTHMLIEKPNTPSSPRFPAPKTPHIRPHPTTNHPPPPHPSAPDKKCNPKTYIHPLLIPLSYTPKIVIK